MRPSPHLTAPGGPHTVVCVNHLSLPPSLGRRVCWFRFHARGRHADLHARRDQLAGRAALDWPWLMQLAT